MINFIVDIEGFFNIKTSKKRIKSISQEGELNGY